MSEDNTMQPSQQNQPNERLNNMFSSVNHYQNRGGLRIPSPFRKYVTQPALALVMFIALALLGALCFNEPRVRSADPGAKTIAYPLATPGENNPCTRRGPSPPASRNPAVEPKTSLPAAVHTTA